MHVMAEWELLRVAASRLAMLLLLVVQVARALARQPEPLAALRALRVLLVPHLLLAGCLGKAAVVAVAMLVQVEQVVQEVEALAAVAVVQHAVHTPLALVA